MSPEEVVAALQSQGVRSRITTNRRTADRSVEARDRVTVAGSEARVALTFQSAADRNGLLMVDVIIDEDHDGSRDRWQQFGLALAQVYGRPIAEGQPERVEKAAIGALREGLRGVSRTAAYEKEGVRVYLTVVTSDRILPRPSSAINPVERQSLGFLDLSIRRAPVNDAVTVRYIRPSDADALLAAAADRGQQRQAEDEARARQGL